MMTKLTCIAVDDEPLALGLVCSFIEQTPFLELKGRYTSALDALKALHEEDINLIFLDIQMPDLTGLELARVLEGQRSKVNRTRVIFTTAYNQFAIDGYKVDALDYLLKPFDYEDFLRAVSKAKSYAELHQKAQQNQVAPIASQPQQEEEYLFLKVEYQLVRIAFEDIRYIEAYKDYVKVFLESADRPVLSLTSLKTLEEKLPTDRFMRIHRSFIVALNKIHAITKNTVQVGEVNISVSNQYKDAFGAFISRWMN